ncbi:MAG: PrpR N-terminal domain-containing protein, partial [Oscillospiraceae bacterium]
MNEVNVLCLTYGGGLSELVSGASTKLTEEHIRISAIEGLCEKQMQTIQDAIYGGVDIIVAGGSNAAFAKRHLDIPVVQIRISAYDYVQAIGRAKKLGKKIAIVTLEGERIPDFQGMAALLGVDVIGVTYCTGDELEPVIRACGADAVIGFGHAVEVAAQMSIPGILIYPGEETVVEAILEGYKLVKEMRRDRARNELTNALIRCTPNSIVIINDQGEIIEFNGEAEKAYGKGALSVKGKRVDEVLESCNLQELLTCDNDPDSDIRTIGERMYLRKQTQITQDKQVTGAIEILAELSDIRHAEYCYSLE